ncbi:MAG: PAS domain-containing protein [Nitrospirae bacterium]|nr:PAS domain-containing protein [Candidatus Manganitrophaceae bacterium]
MILDLLETVVTSLDELFDWMMPVKQEGDVIQHDERRRRYRSLAEAMPIIVWTARPDGPIDHINKQWRNYTGRTFEQSEGWRWMAAVHPEDLQNCLNHLTQAIRVGKRCYLECRLRKNDGDYRWHRIEVVPEKNLKGELMGWFGTAIDINDQKRPKAGAEKVEEEVKVSPDAVRSNACSPFHP